LELTFIQLVLSITLVTDWCEIHENVVLSWDHILSTVETLEDLGHFSRVVGLRSEVEIIKLTSRLHDYDDIIIETVSLSN
jgi:hypothetical protein